MFATLQEQSPMILLQLGLSSELIQNEMQKIRIIEKIEVMQKSFLVYTCLEYTTSRKTRS